MFSWYENFLSDNNNLYKTESYINEICSSLKDYNIRINLLKKSIPRDFNCWCFTSFCHGIIEPQLKWLYSHEKEHLLNTKYKEIKFSDVAKYDILAQYDTNNNLNHTCFFLDDLSVLSKNGGLSLDIYSFQSICREYGNNSRFFRLVK